MPYRFLEDVSLAEIAYKVEAKNLEDLFRDSALALTEIMVDIHTVDEAKSLEVELEGHDTDTLLYRFLNKIVSIKDSEGLIFREYVISLNDTATKLKCTMKGEKINQAKHILRNDVKGVSMYLFGIKRKNGDYTVTVVVDI